MSTKLKAPIYFVALITRDNKPLHIQSFSGVESSTAESEKVPLGTNLIPQEEEKSSDQVKKQEDADSKIEEELSSFMDERKANELLKYNFLSNMALDMFSSRFMEPDSLESQSALLFVEDGISVYGYETNTGLKIVIGTVTKGENLSTVLDEVFISLYKLYLRLICNPFQPLDENSLVSSNKLEKSIVSIVDKWNAGAKW